MKQKTLIITIVTAVVSVALSMIIGFSIPNMKKNKETPAPESSQEGQETLPTGETGEQTESSTEETEPAKDKPYHMANTWRDPAEKTDELNAYSSEQRKYYTKTDLRNGRPTEASYFEYYFGKNTPGSFHVMNKSDDRITLTFVLTEEYDDNTSAILDSLKSFNVQAVFFTCYDYAVKNPDVILRILEEGHVLGSLSASALTTSYSALPFEYAISDLKQLHDYIYDTYGYSMTEFFFPDHIYSFRAMAIVQAAGYRPCFYTIDYADSDPNAVITAKAFADDMKARLHNGAVYSFHTTNVASVITVRTLLEYLSARSYTIGLFD